MNRLYKALPLIFIALVLLVLGSAARLAWQSEMLTKRVETEELSIDSLKEAEVLPMLVSSPLRAMLAREASGARNDPKLMVELAAEYSQRRPLDPRGWLWASLFSQRAGDLAGAIDYLGTAQQLSARTATPLTKVFNRYLELGEVERAMPIARTLVETHPERFRRIFYLLTRLNPDHEGVVNTVIPKISPAGDRFTKDYYYRLALLDAIRAKNTKLAELVWDRTPTSLRSNSQHGLRYLKLLASEQKFAPLAKAWLEYTDQELPIGEIFESNFDREISDYSPCWWNGVADSVGAKWSIDGAIGSGQRSLLLEFVGEENIQFSHLRCLAAVVPGSSYTLLARWKGQDITTLSGPFVDVTAPGVSGFYHRSEAQIGGWPWQTFELNFSVPENVQIVQFRIRRAKTDYLDSKISGKVWFDDFKLSKATSPNLLQPLIELDSDE